MSKFEEYIQRLCRNGQYTPEQARGLAVSRAVQESYESGGETEPMLRHEFSCLSEQ